MAVVGAAVSCGAWLSSSVVVGIVVVVAVVLAVVVVVVVVEIPGANKTRFNTDGTVFDCHICMSWYMV